MKVLHLFNEIKFSGAEIMYANAASLFQEEGIELVAFSTGKELGEFASHFEEENINTYHKPLPNTLFSVGWIQYYVNFYKFLTQHEVDVVHIHRNDLYFFAVVAWISNVKCIKTQHNNFKNRWFTWPVAVVRRFIIRELFGTTFQTIGESVYENELDYYKNPSMLINNWYDSDRFYPPTSDDEKTQLRTKLGIPEKSYVIISTGGCSEIKNHHDIIKALPLVEDKIPNIYYLHLGTGYAESEEKTLADELGVLDKIIFLGNKNNVRDYLVASDVFVMPSQFEGLGNAALEAMACKTQCILYDVAGLKDLIEHDDNGFLIDPGYENLAETILFCYQHRTLAAQKAEAAYKFVNKEYAMSKNISEMIELYKDV